MIHALLALLALVPARAGDPAPAPAAKAAESHGKVVWFDGTFEQALDAAKKGNKLVFIDFWTTWCGWCKKLDKDTYTQDAVVKTLGDVVCFNIDAESKEGAPLAKKFNVQGYPALIVLSPDGSVRDQIGGYLPPDKFVAEIQRVREDRGTLGDMKRQMLAAPKDIDKRYAYAKKLSETGDKEGYDAQIAEIKKLDPDGKSLPLRKAEFEAVMTKVNDLWRDKKPEESPALVSAFLEKETNAELLFQGWNTLAQIQMALAQQATEPALAKSRRMDARTSMRTAWKSCPADEKVGFGTVLASVLYQQKDEMTADEKTFAAELAKAIAPLAQALKTDDDEQKSRKVKALDAAGCAYFLAGMKDEAVKLVQAAIAIDSSNEDVQAHLKAFTGA